MSEKWQEGDRASAVADYISTFDSISLDDVEVEFPELIDGVEIDSLDAVQDLEDSPSY
jgi:hypothetical protein